MSKVPIPAGEPAGRIICPHCGNSKNFVEIADNVMLTSHYIQNHDGSFSQVDTETDVAGGVKLFCGQCRADLSVFHHHFREMIF